MFGEFYCIIWKTFKDINHVMNQYIVNSELDMACVILLINRKVLERIIWKVIPVNYLNYPDILLCKIWRKNVRNRIQGIKKEWFNPNSSYFTSSLSCTWMKRGRANPTWANSGIATLYSELLNSGALSFMSITRMLKVVITVALEGVRSSFSSVPWKNTVKIKFHKELQKLWTPSRIHISFRFSYISYN